MKLVEDIADWWRWWSLRLAALGATITSVMITYPDAALRAWEQLPEEFKHVIPPEYMPLIGVAIFGCSVFARLVKQNAPASKAVQINKHGRIFSMGNNDPQGGRVGDAHFNRKTGIMWVKKPDGWKTYERD